MSNDLTDTLHEFRRHKALAEKAMAPLSDEQFFARPAEQVNSIAIIVKHIAGNLLSRWTDFLTTDGDKPNRNRDGEFVIGPGDTRSSVMAAWEQGWQAVLTTLQSLTASDLTKTITIRGEPHTAEQATMRSLTHTAYHVGQILYLARWLKADAPWLTIAPGQSRQHTPTYRAPT
jgi:uncharacterized damage-inducible protein DinB